MRKRRGKIGEMGRHRKNNPSRVPTELETAFCAGFFEGEGWCGKTRGGIQVECRLTQKDAQILHRIREIYGGYVQFYRGRDRHPINYLCLHGGRAEEFLHDVYPYCSDRRKAQIQAAISPKSVESIRRAPTQLRMKTCSE